MYLKYIMYQLFLYALFYFLQSMSEGYGDR